MSFNPEELDKKKEAVQMIYGGENVLSVILYCTSSAKETIDMYGEGIGIYSMLHYPEFIKAHKEALSRGVRIRIITEITKENLQSVKEAMQFASDVRHMDTITHSFGVSEKHYIGTKLQYGNPSFSQSLFSNTGWFVREQQFLFETLWNKAIPLKQRIMEIEEGHKRQFMDTIRDPIEVLDLLPSLMSSAYEEIKLLFPNSKTLKGFESAGLAELIKNQIQKNSNVRVKLLLRREKEELEENVHNDDSYYHHHQQEQRYNSQVKDSSIGSKKLLGQDNVKVKFANPDRIDTKTALVIVDGEKMMTIELNEEKDDHESLQPNLIDSIRFATHTNSESAIMSHASIFERIWIESEMKPQRQQQR